MNVDPLIIPALLLTAALFFAGLALAEKRRIAPAVWIVAGALALPAALFDAYYLHFVDHAWYYQFRSLPFIELLGAGVGFGAGLLAVQSRRARFVTPASVAVICLLVVLIPYLKMLVTPLSPATIQNRWKDGVCLQTSEASCGPASAATLMTMAGVPITERELVAESYTSRHGTENWYLARAIRRHGLEADYVESGPDPKTLPYPAIAGLGFGRAGHFIAILGETPTGYIIADPLVGREVVDKKFGIETLHLSGFFLVVKRPMN